MKIDESKFQKFHAVWKVLRRPFQRHPIVDEAVLTDVPDELPKQRVNPLDRIQEHLRHHGLGQRVNVRLETAGDGFVLEDDDGVVHAKDFAAAVTVIERMWLYQP